MIQQIAVPNRNLYKEYLSIFREAELTTKKFFSNHRQVFLNFSLSVEDVVQEINIIVLKIIEKFEYKPKEELEKLVSNAIFWKLCSLLKNLKKRMYIELKNRPQTVQECDIKEIETNFLFDELKKKLEQRQYIVLYEVVVNQKSIREVSNQMNVSRQWVNRIYNSALANARIFLVN